MSESKTDTVADAAAVSEPIHPLKYRAPKVKPTLKVQCPFCLIKTANTITALTKHIPNCRSYDPFKDGLPRNNPAYIMIGTAYSLNDFFDDEMTYFNTLNAILDAGTLADAPTDSVDEIRTLIDSFITLANDAPLLIKKRRDAITWRIIHTLFEMREDVIEQMLGFLKFLEEDDA
jgi:hypothetical protein